MQEIETLIWSKSGGTGSIGVPQLQIMGDMSPPSPPPVFYASAVWLCHYRAEIQQANFN